jgi:hypothetical protein
MIMKRLAISFSGGRTSAVMTKMLLEKYRDTDTEISVTFANTGCEHEATLEFVKACDEHFGFGTVWIEAVITHEKGVGPRSKVVDFETASRKGEPFEEYIKKSGMPGPTHPHCTARLKEDVMYDYRRKLGWHHKSYWTAIGIRADECDRVSAKAKEKQFYYPLVEWGITKDMVASECKKWPFDLMIKGDHYGNCTWCWKKSMRKLMTLAVEEPSIFDFPAMMEKKYTRTKQAEGQPDRKFFRGNMTVADIFKKSKEPFNMYEDSKQMSFFEFDDFLDIGSGCGESCEIGADEMPSTPYRDSLQPSSLKFDRFKDFGSCSGESWDTGADE